MLRIKRAEFDAGELICPRCRKAVDPKTTTVSFVPSTPLGADRRRRRADR